jgi:xanthine dehydrogenase YagR molybdenum-binding subunit
VPHRAHQRERDDGVIDVLTHENRPRMAGTDGAYKDDAAPEGSPSRPLYDDRILFSGQPIALVVAEESEIARFLGLASAVADIGRVVG